MQNTIKPIETVYNGRRFRSRLEARWAVYFDALGVRYEYEPEGFVLPSGKKYLPDFCVKCYGCRGIPLMDIPFDLYIEVKGKMTEYDAERIKEFSGILCLENNACTYDDYLSGPHYPMLILPNIPNCNSSGWEDEVYDVFDKYEYGLSPFSYYTVDGDEYAAFPLAHQGKLYLWAGDYDWYPEDMGQSIIALDKARMARFENF